MSRVLTVKSIGNGERRQEIAALGFMAQRLRNTGVVTDHGVETKGTSTSAPASTSAATRSTGGCGMSFVVQSWTSCAVASELYAIDLGTEKE